MKKLILIFCPLIFFLTGGGSLYAQTILINEIQYVNRNTIKDSDEASPDWVEIINASNNPINIKGYKLTDDTTETDFWSFPEYLLQPDSVLLVFASGKNKTDLPELHTDFRLAIMKEPVFLLNPHGSVIDVFEATCVPPDKSAGRFPGKTDAFKILTPTPGAPNNTATEIEINFQKDTLIADINSGMYSNPLNVHLSNQNSQNNIYYSLDGNDPDDKSLLYSEGIGLNDINSTKNRVADKVKTGYEPGNLISKANILRARVFSEGCPASNEINNTYFINESKKSNYQVPVVSIITDKDNLFDDETGIYVSGNHTNYNRHGKKWEREVGLEIFMPDGNIIIDQNAGIRIHGRGSRSAAQKSFRLYARDEYGKDFFNYPFFEAKPSIDHFKTLLLRSTREWSGTMFKDELCQVLVQDMNVDNTAARTCVLFLNGEYWGIYSLRERHDEYYVENNYKVSPASIDVIGYDKEKVLVEAGSSDAYTKLLEDLNSFDATSDEFYDFASKNIDLDNLMDFYVAQLYLANVDFPDNNFELWRFRSDTAKWRFFFFDLDGAMIRTGFNHLSEYNNLIDDFQRYKEHSMFILRTLLQNPRFKNEFNARFFHHMSTTFSVDRVTHKIDELENLYAPLAPEQIYRWRNPADYNKWLHNVDMLRLFAIQRPAVMTEQLINNFGSPVTIYPNPTKDLINIKLFAESPGVEVKLYATNGHIVYQNSFSENDLISFQPNVKAGLYFLQIRIESAIYSEKVIIQ